MRVIRRARALPYPYPRNDSLDMADVNTIHDQNDSTVAAFPLPVEEILSDYRTATLSRQASLLGRRRC